MRTPQTWTDVSLLPPPVAALALLVGLAAGAASLIQSGPDPGHGRRASSAGRTPTSASTGPQTTGGGHSGVPPTGEWTCSRSATIAVSKLENDASSQVAGEQRDSTRWPPPQRRETQTEGKGQQRPEGTDVRPQSKDPQPRGTTARSRRRP